MKKRPGPTLRSRKLAKELQTAREALGMSVRTLAKEVGLVPGTISKIENARQAILVRHIKLFGRELGMSKSKIDQLVLIAADDETDDWMVEFRDDIPEWFGTYVDLEPEAEEIWTYASEIVDGLVQTPDYAEAIVLAFFPDLSTSQMRRIVQVRRARQAILDRPEPPHLRLVLNEAVVRRRVGDPRVMRDQLLHLRALAERPNITLTLLPFEAGAHPAMKGSFTMLRFPEGFDDMDCVYLENENGSVWHERSHEIGRYAEVFERIVKISLSEADTVAWLDSLVKSCEST
ncbi:Helix-turn-helix [Lentzea fradiae]|uniref:Helix-turn-helix n=1 Tax=Lentzea fradiae TaxID=200378 RepID=A0A1G7TEK8_9PSEU|nr:helix-turn-helix transcriptional regulator [Lentzea fradiae]SDG33474.1 Helix-turn-helix [Lentzea fradiae]